MKKTELLRDRDIIKKTGIDQPNISGIMHGRRTVSIVLARKLFLATGYKEETWLYPNLYKDNPYMKRAKRRKAKKAREAKG